MRPELRSTRRGWMTFSATPTEGSGGGAAQPAAADPAAANDPAAATQPVDYKALLLQLLGLDAAAADAAIEAKASEVQGTLTKVPELETAAAGAGDAATKLQEANAELERVRGEYQTLFDRDQAAQKAKQDAEVDAILEQYADRLTDDKAKGRIRAILVSDREAGMEILNGLPAAAAAPSDNAGAATPAAPPAPKHDPANAAASGPTEEEIAKKTRVRAAELQKEFPKKSNAELFAQAEKEVRAQLSTAKAA